MTERFGGFENHFEQPETPEQRFRNLARQEADRIHWESLDPLAREIAEKILFKLDLKDRIEDVERHHNDTAVYQSLKKLGLLLVFDRVSEHEWKDKNSDFVLQKDDHYLDLHLPPVRPDDKKTLLSQMRRSFNLLAEYINKQQLNPKYVLGVTFEKLASASRRFGFKIISPPVPDDVRRGVENVYRDFVQPEKSKNGEEIGEIMLCYQELDEFMKRYSKP